MHDDSRLFIRFYAICDSKIFVCHRFRLQADVVQQFSDWDHWVFFRVFQFWSAESEIRVNFFVIHCMRFETNSMNRFMFDISRYSWNLNNWIIDSNFCIRTCFYLKSMSSLRCCFDELCEMRNDALFAIDLNHTFIQCDMIHLWIQ